MTAHLTPLERRTVILCGKAYMWHRQAPGAPLELFPGHAPGDPTGCQAVEAPMLTTTWPRTCVLYRAHGTRHLHKPTLDATPEWWGEPPRRQGPVVIVPGLDGYNVTTGAEPENLQ